MSCIQLNFNVELVFIFATCDISNFGGRYFTLIYELEVCILVSGVLYLINAFDDLNYNKI